MTSLLPYGGEPLASASAAGFGVSSVRNGADLTFGNPKPLTNP